MIPRPHKPAWSRLLGLALAIGTWVGASTAFGQTNGRVQCAISENSRAASGTLVLQAGSKEAARGICGAAPVSVPAGTYRAVLRLDGALDAPERRTSVVVKPGKVAKVSADFATGTLEVTILQGGKPAAGMVVIREGGRQIGTLAGGVAAHLSTGSYEITVRYRAQQKRLGSVTISRGERRTLQVEFE